jgi:PEP-CTERM motif-containing protein
MERRAGQRTAPFSKSDAVRSLAKQSVGSAFNSLFMRVFTMGKRFVWFVPCTATLVGVLLCGSVCQGDLANLSDWVGNNNTGGGVAGNNNYTVLSPTSAGGTFQTRISPGTTPPTFYLADTSLAGGPYGYDTPLSMSGKITFTNPSNVDPLWHFGWFSSTNVTNRLGFSANDASLGANHFRYQTAWSVLSPSGSGAKNMATDDSGVNSALSSIPAGTYNFTLTYTPGASNNLSAQIDPGGSNWRAINMTVNRSTAGVFDRFGFLQLGQGSPVTTTFTTTVNDINYTGETQVPEPASMVMLLFAGVVFAAQLRRKK